MYMIDKYLVIVIALYIRAHNILHKFVENVNI